MNETIYRNNKTGIDYIHCGFAINVTNNIGNQTMVIYRDPTIDLLTFVREEKEFYTKFTEIG